MTPVEVAARCQSSSGSVGTASCSWTTRPIPNSDAGGDVEVDHLFTGAVVRWAHLHRELRPHVICRERLVKRAGDFATSINSCVTSRHLGDEGGNVA